MKWGLSITGGTSTGVAAKPPSSSPAETPSTVSVSSSKPGLSCSLSNGLGAGTAGDCWDCTKTNLRTGWVEVCPLRLDYPDPSFLIVFFSSKPLVGHHLQGNQPLSCRKMNCPDRLVSLQSHRVVPHHLSWLPPNPPPERRRWKVTLSTVGARSCLARPLGDDHCPPKWAMSLMLVESTGELMQKLVQATLVLGWTPLPLGNQPTLVQNQSAHITTSFGLS